jgi:uncharacterized tellurite resistance protein B-like protein
MALDEIQKGHFLNLYHMALCDVEVDTTELEALYRIGEEKGIDKAEIDSIVLRPDLIKFSPPETILEKMEYLYDLAQIAWADGKIDASERRAMDMFSAKFGFQEENIPIIIQFLVDEAEKGTTKEQVLKIVSENL